MERGNPLRLLILHYGSGMSGGFIACQTTGKKDSWENGQLGKWTVGKLFAYKKAKAPACNAPFLDNVTLFVYKKGLGMHRLSCLQCFRLTLVC